MSFNLDRDDSFVTLLSENKLQFLTNRLIETKNVPGDIVEAGIYQGGSLAIIVMNSQRWNKQVCGYDTFEGLPEVTAIDVHVKGEFCYNQLDTLKRKLPSVHFTKGYYPRSDHERTSKVSFAHLDMDLYEPTLQALNHLDGFLSQDAIVVLDDYKWQNCPGIEKAIVEFLASKPGRYKHKAGNDNQYALRRLDHEPD